MGEITNEWNKLRVKESRLKQKRNKNSKPLTGEKLIKSNIKNCVKVAKKGYLKKAWRTLDSKEIATLNENNTKILKLKFED